MNTIRLLFIIFIFFSCQQEHAEKQAILTSIYLINQEGTAYARGFRHGQFLKEEVNLQVSNWEKAMNKYLQLDRDSLYLILEKHTGFMQAIQQVTPDLLEEVYGIADGANIERKLLLAYNVGEEIFNYCTANFESCSNIAFQREQGSYVAYNQDLPDFLHGNQQPIILQHKQHYVFSMPGCIGLSGASINMAVSCNSLPMLAMNRDGLPLAFYLRKLLNLSSVKEAKQFIQTSPLAIPQNLLFVSEKEVLNIEISKEQIKMRAPDSLGTIIHTNFPIDNTDFKHVDYQANNCSRFHYLDSMSPLLAALPEHNFSKVLQSTCSTQPIFNTETYLRYVATYTQENSPQLVFINPATKEEVKLKF